MATIQFTFSTLGHLHYASADGEAKFYLGTETAYKGRVGLFNTKKVPPFVYDAQAFSVEHKHWAWFLQPTAQCESQGSYLCLNTYDRAAFTYGFMQFAAHVPGGDFVQFFKALLTLPEAKAYFPFLELREGHIWYARSTQAYQLENNTTTTALMNYLNQESNAIDTQELIASARMVHWAQSSAGHRAAQVSNSIMLYKKHLKDHSTRFNLNGWPDYICQVICDIFHQGRSSYQTVRNILLSTSSREAAYQKLLNIGTGHYDGRIRTLKAEHKRLRNAGIFGKTYNAATNNFS